MKHLLKVGCWSVVLAVLACGRGQTDKDLVDDGRTNLAPQFGSQSFADWCGSWGLSCGADHAGNADKLRAERRIVAGAMQGDINWTLSAEALRHEQLSIALGHLGIKDILAPAFDALLGSGFQSVEASRGRIQAKWPKASTIAAPAGFQWQMNDAVVFTPDMDGRFNFQGLGAARLDLGARFDVPTRVLDGAGRENWAGEAFVLTAVPPDFFLKQFYLDESQFPTEFGQRQMITALSPLVGFAVSFPGQWQLNDSFWRTLSEEADHLSSDQAERDNIRAFGDGVASLTIKAHSLSHLEFAAQESSKNLVCESSGSNAMTLEFSNSFGAEKVRRIGLDATQLTFYGIKVKTEIFGPVATSFNLKRVDLHPDKVVIRDIPVIGSYTIKLEEFAIENSMAAATDLACRAE